MIIESNGNLLASNAEALVNTVNTVGVMGKGIALQFKRAYPENFKAYERACKNNEIKIGKMFACPVMAMSNPSLIINFPTKRHWRSQSRLEDIQDGLDDLVNVLIQHGVKSVAVPALGCGNGGLPWSDVYPLIIAASERVPDINFLVYPPAAPPPAETMPVRSKRPGMTERRAAMLLAFDRYAALSTAAGHSIGGEISIVEAQKVAYFLQQAGWPSRFEFVASHYGPYSHTVDQWLSSVEGHFISGYGDGTSGSRAVLTLDGRAVTEARELMNGNSEFSEKLDRMAEFVCGFESPYGVELLSTVHFIVAKSPSQHLSLDQIARQVKAWSQRKAQLFQPHQAKVAVEHLQNIGAFVGSLAIGSGQESGASSLHFYREPQHCR